MEKKVDATVHHYEDVEDGFAKIAKQSDAMGTVTITDTKDIFLVPSPSADPRGPHS